MPNTDVDNKRVLDVCCGSRMFWFDRENKNAVFCDIRDEEHVLCDGRELKVIPDVKADFTSLPFSDETFNIVVFDPPHLVKLGDTSWMFKKYGRLNTGWMDDLENGFNECFRVLKDNGTLIFKWNETQIKVKEVLKLAKIKPLFGNISGKRSNTHWITFIK